MVAILSKYKIWYIMKTFISMDLNSQRLIIYLLSFAVFLVVKHSSNVKHMPKKSSHIKEKTAKKAESKAKKASSAKSTKKQLETEQISVDDTKAELQTDEPIKKSSRPEDEVVVYKEVEFELREIVSNGSQVLIGPLRLTRFERARITGARSLQLSLGAPSLIRVPNDVRDSISLATVELDLKALPISIRRILPNGLYQDISITLLK
jgi:DNA-directed RNA polymerases I, II, and III subunit RPABC2